MTRRAVAVAVTVVGATLLLATQASRLRVEVDPDAQLPQGHPYVQALNRLHEVFGEKNLVFVGLFPKDGTVWTPRFLAKLSRVSERIGALPGVVERTFLSLAAPKVVDISGDDAGMTVRPFLEPPPRTAAEAAAVRERLEANPQYLDVVVARDGSAAAIVADFDFRAPLDGYPEVHAAILDVLAAEQDGSFEACLGGPAIYVAWLARYSARMFLFLPLALLVIGLVHYEAFRSVQAVVLPTVTALLAMLWSLGLLGSLGVALDPFNVTTPILILAVAAGHAVQMLSRFYEELARDGDARLAVERSLERVAPVMLVAGTIACLSFLSLLAFETAAIRNFGLLTALGIAAALVIELTLIPAVRTLLPTPSLRERSRQASARPLDRALAGLAASLGAGGWKRVLAAGVAVAAVFGLAATRLRIDSSFRGQFFPSATPRQDDRALNQAFAGTSTLVILIEGPGEGTIDEPALLLAVDRLSRWFEAQPGVGKAVSFVDFVRRMHAALARPAPGEPTLPASRSLVAQYLMLYSMTGAVDDFDALVDPAHRVCALRVFVKEDSTRFTERLIAGAEGQLQALLPAGYRFQVTGSLASSQALNEVMVRGKLANVVQIALIVLVVASLAFRSAAAGAAAAVPLALAVVTNLGTMAFVGIPLDIGTATISAMAVGIGADYAVYFLFRLREETRGGRDLGAATAAALGTAGRAILLVSTAIAAGYLTLCFSGFGYHMRLGTLVALAMMVSSIASLTLLPAVVFALRPAFVVPAARPAAAAVERAEG